MAMALFNTPEQGDSDDSLSDTQLLPTSSLSSLCTVLRTPVPRATLSPRAVWEALSLEPMCEEYQMSGDKEALSVASWPLYLCLQTIPDPEP